MLAPHSSGSPHHDPCPDSSRDTAQNIVMANFTRAAADKAQPWLTTVDMWYSERVVDVHDAVPKWCASYSG